MEQADTTAAVAAPAAAVAEEDARLNSVVSKIFSSLRREMDSIVNSADLAGTAAAPQQQPGAADEGGPPLHLLHGRTLSETPGYDDYQLPHPVQRLPDVLEYEPLAAAFAAAGQRPGATAALQEVLSPHQAAALMTPAVLQGGVLDGADADDLDAASTATLGRRTLSYRELLERALAWNPSLAPPTTATPGRSSAGGINSDAGSSSRRVSSAEWHRHSMGSMSGSPGKLARPASTGRAAAAASSPQSPPNRYGSQSSPSHALSKFPGRQPHSCLASSHISLSCSSRPGDVAAAVSNSGARKAAAPRSPVRPAWGQRSASAPREAPGYSQRAAATSPVKATSVSAGIPAGRQQQQQAATSQARASKAPRDAGVDRLYTLGVERQHKRVQAPRAEALSSVRLSEQEWSRVTSRLYHDAEVKQARMHQRRQEQEARLQELCSAPAGGRSRSTSPHASDRYYVASRHAGSPEARRGVSGQVQDGGFYMRQLALLQKRAERAAQKRPSDEDSLLECTFKPKINATSQSLHRSVEQLHMWDARRKLSVYEKALDKCEHEDEGYTFVPQINALSRQLALANYTVNPDPAHPWTTSPKHTRQPSVSPPRASRHPSPEALRMLRDTLPPPHVMMLAGATAAHTQRLRDVHAAPGDAVAYLRPEQQQQQQHFDAATSPERRACPSAAPPLQHQEEQEAAAADCPAPHQWQLQAEAVVGAAGFEEVAAADPPGIVMGLPVAVAVACEGAAALPVATQAQVPEAAAPDMQLQPQLAALKIKAAAQQQQRLSSSGGFAPRTPQLGGTDDDRPTAAATAAAAATGRQAGSIASRDDSAGGMHGNSCARKTSSGGCIFNAAARKGGALGSPLARLASEQQLGGVVPDLPAAQLAVDNHLGQQYRQDALPVHYVAAAAAGGLTGGGNSGANSSGYSARYKHRTSSKLLMAADAGNKAELQGSPTAADVCAASIGVSTPRASGAGAPGSDAFAAALEHQQHQQQQQQHWAADCAMLLQTSTAGGVAPSTPTVSAGGTGSTQQSPDGGAEQQTSSETLSLRSKYGQARADSGRKVQEQQPPQQATALHVVVMAPPQLPCSSSVVSLPDCTAAGGGRGASESCNAGIQQQSAAKVEGLLEQTRSVPFELVLSPRGSTAGNMCIDASSALGQQLLAMLASGGQQQLQQHPSAGAAGPTQLLIDSLLQPVATIRPGAAASFESATPPSTLDGTAAVAAGDAEAAELAAELTALLRPDAGCLSPQEKAQRVAATFIKTMSRRLNLSPEVLQQTMAAALDPAAAASPGAPATAASPSPDAAPSVMEFGLPEADNMQELLKRVSGGSLLSPQTSLRQQQQECRHAAAPTEEEQERESEEFPSLVQAQGGITHAATPAWPAVPAPVAACKRWADVVARSPAEA